MLIRHPRFYLIHVNSFEFKFNLINSIDIMHRHLHIKINFPCRRMDGKKKRERKLFRKVQ